MNRRTRNRLAAWVAVFALGCSSSAGGCGGCVEPLPAEFPTALQIENAATAKISRKGLDFFEQRINDIISTFAGAGGLDLAVPCTKTSQRFVYDAHDAFSYIPAGLIVFDQSLDLYACDHSQNLSCADETGGTATPPANDPNATLTPPLKQCQAKASMKTLSIDPVQQANGNVDVTVTLEMRVNTGTIPVVVDTAPLGTPFDICGQVRCNVEYDSNRGGTAPTEVPLNLTLNLRLDPDGNLLAFNLAGLDISEIFEASDLALSDGGGACSVVCGLLEDFSFVKDFILEFMRPLINTKIRDTVDQFRCRACEGDGLRCPSGSTCVADQGVCYTCDPAVTDRCAPMYDPDNNPANEVRDCPPAMLGLEGRVGAGAALANFGASTDSLLDIHAVAGSVRPTTYPAQVQNGGIVLSLRGGTRSAIRDPAGNVTPGTAVCVPHRDAPPAGQPAAIDFDAVARALAPNTPLVDYHLGFAISDKLLDRGLYDAYESGLLCLNVDADVVELLSSSTFMQFLPSLRVLAEGRDVPMLIALRPKQAPKVTIGKGTVRQSGSDTIPDDPLVTLDLQDLQLDFYALLEERYARVFSLRTDVTLPLALEFNPTQNTARPVLANLRDTLRSLTIENAEMLPSDEVERFQALVEAILGLVQRALGSALGPIQLPSVSGFKVVVLDAKGAISPTPGGAVTDCSSTNPCQQLAMFTNLDVTTAPLTARADTRAELIETVIPEKSRVFAGERPTVRVKVAGRGVTPVDFGGWEYSFAVDGSLWSPWTHSDVLEIRSPQLVLQGRHQIDLRTREAGVPSSEDETPARITAIVDYDAPRVALELEQDGHTVRTVATDSVSRDDELTFRYRVAGADWESSSGARSFELSALGAQPSLEVEVTDGVGLKSIAAYGLRADELNGPVGDRREAKAGTGPGSGVDDSGGCASASIASLGLLGLLGCVPRRRSK